MTELRDEGKKRSTSPTLLPARSDGRVDGKPHDGSDQVRKGGDQNQAADHGEDYGKHCASTSTWANHGCTGTGAVANAWQAGDGSASNWAGWNNHDDDNAVKWNGSNEAADSAGNTIWTAIGWWV